MAQFRIWVDHGGDLWIRNADIPDEFVESDMLADGILTQGTRTPVLYRQITGLPLTAGKLTTGTYPIGTIPGGSLLFKCIVVAGVAFDGNTAITIGDASSHAGILADAHITKTLAAVSGEDPADYGTYLYVPGVQTTITQTKTPSAWAVTGLALNEGTPNTFLSVTQGSTAGDWTVTASPVVTTYGHPKQKWYADDTVINAYLTSTTGTVGELDVYLFYWRGVMSG